MDREALGIYLQDHFAGSTGGRDLAARAAGANEGNAYGAFLSRLVEEIEEDQAALAKVMDAVGIGPDRLKVAGAWVGEKVGRLKTNGSLTYSPLSRLIELEGLTLGVTGKRGLWEHLTILVRTDPEPDLAAFDFPALAARAQSQLDGLAEQREHAAREAFASTTPA